MSAFDHSTRYSGSSSTSNRPRKRPRLSSYQSSSHRFTSADPLRRFGQLGYHEYGNRLNDGQIRLIGLLSGQWGDEIHCELYTAYLEDEPRYKALSYVWGSQKNLRPVFLDGALKLVTVNLEQALRRLRKTDSALTLWVDAICIDQSNLWERTKQVQCMRDIFSGSQEVIVHLGEVLDPDFANSLTNSPAVVAHATDIVFFGNHRDKEKLLCFKDNQFLVEDRSKKKARSSLDYGLEVFCFLRLLADGWKPECERPLIHSKYHRNLFDALRLFMTRTYWWYRVWVIQEVVVPEEVTVRYGPMVAPLDMFVKAAHSYTCNRHAWSIFYGHEFTSVLSLFSRTILAIHQLRELWRKREQTDLLPLLRQFSGRKATDDRDKVYALLGLVTEPLSIVPNYTLSTSMVFQNTALHVIERTESLIVLAGDLSRKDRKDLPSWVPDWSVPSDELDLRRIENSEFYNATAGSKIYVKHHSDRILSGIDRYLSYLLKEYNNKHGTSLGFDSVKDYNDVLGTTAWKDWLSPLKETDGEDRRTRHEICREAIENFYIASGGPVCLRDHGFGLLSLPGLHIDYVVIKGSVMFADNDLKSTIQSWGILAAEHEKHLQQRYFGQTGDTLGAAFRRTLCADMISQNTLSASGHCRRVCDTDQNALAHWFLSGTDSPFSTEYCPPSSRLLMARKKLFSDFDGLECKTTMPEYEDVDAAIRTATYRRTFFITAGGSMGLGPAKMGAGDHVFALLGGKTPFILRDSTRRFGLESGLSDAAAKNRIDLEVIGDCYLHGFMDGEVMLEWQKRAPERLKSSIHFNRKYQQWIKEASNLTRCEWNLREAERKTEDANSDHQRAEENWKRAEPISKALNFLQEAEHRWQTAQKIAEYTRRKIRPAQRTGKTSGLVIQPCNLEQIHRHCKDLFQEAEEDYQKGEEILQQAKKYWPKAEMIRNSILVRQKAEEMQKNGESSWLVSEGIQMLKKADETWHEAEDMLQDAERLYPKAQQGPRWAIWILQQAEQKRLEAQSAQQDSRLVHLSLTEQLKRNEDDFAWEHGEIEQMFRKSTQRAPKTRVSTGDAEDDNLAAERLLEKPSRELQEAKLSMRQAKTALKEADQRVKAASLAVKSAELEKISAEADMGGAANEMSLSLFLV